MSLYESGENYLETILILKEKYGYVRSIDVARELNVSKPSVSRAVSVLKNDGYISFDQNGMIVLTDEGTRVANKIYERHNIITKHLISLGVSEEVASNDACKIEHVLSDETFERIKDIVDNIK